jgi:hypothetical protein
MTAIQEMIEIIKQKRNESEISNTLLRFVHDEAIRLLEKEKKQQDELAIGFTDWMICKAEKYNSYLCLIKDYKELLEIYKKTL